MADNYTAPSGSPDLPWLYRRSDDQPVGVVAPNGKEVLFGGSTDTVAREMAQAAGSSAGVLAAVQGMDSKQKAQAAAAVNAGSAALASSNGFDAIAAGARLTHDMRFGTASSGGTHQIKSLSDLDANFYYDPLFSANTTTTRMAYHDQFHEFAKFDAADASTVYVFGTNSLTLQPYAQHSWDGVVTQIAAGSSPVSGASVAASSLGLADTSGLWIGRVVAQPYGQFAARVTAFDGSNVTLTALTGTTGQTLGYGGQHLMLWTTMTALPLANAGSLGATSLTLASSAPAQVQNGMVCCAVDSFNYIKRYYYGSQATVSGTSVTLTAPGLQQAVASGKCVVFVPYTRTGQLVPKTTWPEPGPGRALLMELDATWAANASGVAPRTQYMDTLAAYTTAGGANTPMGGWASWWLYEQQGVTNNDQGGAEIDMVEQFCDINFGPGDFSCSWHNNTAVFNQSEVSTSMLLAEGYPTYVRWNGTDQAYYALRNAGPPVIPSQVMLKRVSGTVPAAMRVQLVWERHQVSIYRDGVLYVRLRGSWASARPAQMLINAALGILSDLGNMHVPWSNAGLANCRLVLRSLKVWEL